MKYVLHYKDEATYEIEAASKEAAIAQGDEYWANRIPTVDVEVVSKIKSRLDAIESFKKNAETLEQAAAVKEQNERNELIAKIRALEPRINELIAVGNACIQSNIPLTGREFGCRESYDTHQFFTDSVSHLVGFAGKPWMSPCHIEFMGINGGGACGAYDFRTDGIKVFSVHENNPRDIIEPSIGHMRRFLDRFDEFESALYAYVDRTIEKQQKSVDKLIQNAQEKQVAGKASSASAAVETPVKDNSVVR